MKNQKTISHLANSQALKRVFNKGITPIDKTDIQSLSSRNDLIIKSWTSKKGIEYVLYNNNGMNLQIEKSCVHYYKVLNNNSIVQ